MIIIFKKIENNLKLDNTLCAEAVSQENQVIRNKEQP